MPADKSDLRPHCVGEVVCCSVVKREARAKPAVQKEGGSARKGALCVLFHCCTAARGGFTT